MPLNVKALRGLQDDLKNKSGEGEGVLFFSNKLSEETQVRFLPPSEEMNGVYFVEQEGWWVDGKFYLSNTTKLLGGKVDVIEEELEAAKKSSDPDVRDLAKAKNQYGIPVVKREVRYLLPMVLLDVKYDDDDYVEDIKELEARVLVAKPTLMRKINQLVTARPYQNGKPDGMMDREEGWNVILSKTGKGKDTEYDATGWTEKSEMSKKWYTDETWEKVDPVKLTKEFGKSDEYLTSVIRNYLYGEEIIEDSDESQDDEKPKRRAAGRRPAAAKESEEKPARRGRKPQKSKAPVDLGEEEEEPKQRGQRRTGGRSLLDDAAGEMDGLD